MNVGNRQRENAHECVQERRRRRTTVGFVKGSAVPIKLDRRANLINETLTCGKPLRDGARSRLSSRCSSTSSWPVALVFLSLSLSFSCSSAGAPYAATTQPGYPNARGEPKLLPSLRARARKRAHRSTPLRRLMPLAGRRCACWPSDCSACSTSDETEG